MTPLELLGLIAVFAIVRVAISFVPQRVTAGGPAETTARSSTITVVREYLDAFIVAGLVALFLITFVVRTFFIPSGSMEPTLQIHDVLLVNEFEYRFSKPHEGDIVVFPPPVVSPNDFIKRAIGLPGDRIRVHQGVVYRNGVAMNEPYIAEKPTYELEVKDYGIYVDGFKLDPHVANVPPREKWQAPDRIPDGCYLMFGDNRTNSEDSHAWGFAQTGGTFASGERAGQKASFTGHAFLLFWPFNRIRILH
ncbi:signal peptidase I [Vulcanimicrobium alpinum]|uniref:Signal peptidase I n=1 Tax=Vulcanimicrobium alpinum TaxID=3016050 RepID=A0AAN2C983_UNVUL|nr:signal peptidase I [Vulcanimicrobium alpinum]BDE05322.1 signal peptidase I [Vulcanimicrobium alpinum]